MEELIRISETSTGSIMWNSAKQHKNLIQQHSFWEVKNGSNARFSEDSWQQMPKLRDLFPPNHLLEQDMQPHDTVRNFWHNSSHQDYREWLKATQILSQGPMQDEQILDTELMKRKIQFSEEKDILRWGYEEKRTYSIREAYNILIKEHMVLDSLWRKIWDPSFWPKVSTFLWLLCHNKILTWDNLRKKNFYGPSICPNYKKDEETIEHLMYLCPLAHRLWQKISFHCQKEGGSNGDITATMRNWYHHPYQSKILNFL